MLCCYYVFLLSVFTKVIHGNLSANKRQKRYLIFTPSTQYGVFATVSVPLPEPDNLVSVAWFLEANYYNVDNTSYFDPLLGDIVFSRSRDERETSERSKRSEILTRSILYRLIESMLENNGYRGRECLLRSICEAATSHFSHNGLLGDLLHLILTPSASLEEDEVNDCYYEAEYYGLDGNCGSYLKHCPLSPLDDTSMFIDHLL